MGKLVFADGTEMNDVTISQESQNRIMISIPGVSSMLQAAITFDNASKTSTMTYTTDIRKFIYRGFTTLEEFLLKDESAHLTIGSKGIHGYSLANDSNSKSVVYMTGTNPTVVKEYTVDPSNMPGEIYKRI